MLANGEYEYSTEQGPGSRKGRRLPPIFGTTAEEPYRNGRLLGPWTKPVLFRTNFSQGSTNRRKLSGQVGLFGFLPTKTRVAGRHTGVHKDNRRDTDNKQAQQVEYTRF